MHILDIQVKINFGTFFSNFIPSNSSIFLSTWYKSFPFKNLHSSKEPSFPMDIPTSKLWYLLRSIELIAISARNIASLFALMSNSKFVSFLCSCFQEYNVMDWCHTNCIPVNWSPKKIPQWRMEQQKTIVTLVFSPKFPDLWATGTLLPFLSFSTTKIFLFAPTHLSFYLYCLSLLHTLWVFSFLILLCLCIKFLFFRPWAYMQEENRR